MDEQSSQEKSEIDPFTLFPAEMQQAVTGLSYIGQLSEDIVFCGHTFSLKTLRPAEKLAAGVALQPYRNTVAEVDAFQALYVGLAVTSVDGDADFCPPIGPNMEDYARARLNFVLNGKDGQGGWYSPTIEYLWREYTRLDATAAQAVKELHRLSQRGQHQNLQPWLGSLTEQGTSHEETPSESPIPTPSS